MGFLSSNTNEVIIDAVLTKEGRQKLASMGSLGISKFALSDDEIDYSLYNVDNPNGTDYYDTALSNMPVLEALPASTDSLRYKLFTNTSALTQNVLSLGAMVAYRNDPVTGLQLTYINDHSEYSVTPYLNNPGISLPPSITQGVFYVAKLTAFNGRGISDITFRGLVSQNSLSPSTLAALTRAQADIANRTANVANPQVLEQAGTYFSLKVKDGSTITSQLQFKILLQASGPVNAQAFELTITVAPMSAVTIAS